MTFKYPNRKVLKNSLKKTEYAKSLTLQNAPLNIDACVWGESLSRKEISLKGMHYFFFTTRIIKCSNPVFMLIYNFVSWSDL